MLAYNLHHGPTPNTSYFAMLENGHQETKEGGKRLHAFVLRQRMGERVDFTTKSCSFSFQTAVSLLLWAGCDRHKETLLLLHLSLCPTSTSGNVIMKFIRHEIC